MFTQIEENWSAGSTCPHTFPLTPPLFPDLHNHNYITNMLTWFLDAARRLIDCIWNYCRTIMICGHWLILKYMHVRRSTVIVLYVPDAMKRIRITVKGPLAIWINNNNVSTKTEKAWSQQLQTVWICKQNSDGNLYITTFIISNIHMMTILS